MRTAAIAIVLVALLSPSWSRPLHAQSAGLDAAWRKLFRRDDNLPSPPGNPLHPSKVMLGAKLFSDTRFSGNGKRSCATCHRRERAFTDGKPLAEGLSGAPLQRNTPSLWNLAWGKHHFWDGRVASLEEQVGMPIDAAEEMGGHWPDILRKLGDDAEIVSGFQAAFPDSPEPSRAAIVDALASYVRSLVSPQTRFDAWIAGDQDALRPAEVRGLRLFTGKAGCVLCHAGWRFTDDRFHDIGLASSDPGRGAVPGGTPGLKAFKTPSLRELAYTAPYMHDGSRATLAAVIRHYSGGFIGRPSLSTHMNRNLRLDGNETSDLIAFLQTLSSEAKPTPSPGGSGFHKIGR